MSAKVCLAISSFRNDDAVSALLEAVVPLVPAVFTQVIVVDSLGTQALPELIERRGWKHVRYESARVNLGSAGNLARRLQLAAESGAEFVYALNHDGQISQGTVSALVRAATSTARIGAAYPLRTLPNRGGVYDVTGTSRCLLPRRTRLCAPTQQILPAYWGSSNGALYSLKPVRAGLLPCGDFWMGWEDLGYGWLLDSSGYRQIIVCDAVFEDPYEFRAVQRRARGVYVTEKPAWYAYYFARNLLLIRRQLRPAWPMGASLVSRILLEAGVTALLRPQKRERFALLARGVRDGLRGVTGQRL